MKTFFTLFFFLFLIQYVEGQVDLNAGLIGYFPLNGNANDIIGGHNGIAMNGVQPTTDRYGNPNGACYFDGIDDYIIVDDAGAFSPSNISITAWVYTESTGPQSVIGKIEYTTGFAASYQIGLNYDIQTGFFWADYVNQPGNTCFEQYPYNPTYPFSKSVINPSAGWHCLVATLDNTVEKLYVDGVLVDIQILPSNNVRQCVNTQFIIGHWWSGDLLAFKGKIDEIRVYNRAINQDEVLALCDIQTSNTLCTGSLGDPVVKIDFGSGNNPGQELPSVIQGASTTLNYGAVSGNPAGPALGDGQYTITNNIPSNNLWLSGKEDHTPGDVNGYMAVFNATSAPGEFYNQTISGLCKSTTYEFAAWVANVLDPAKAGGVFPDIMFVIQKPDGTPIATYDTKVIAQHATLTWQQYGFFFTMPNDLTSVVLRLINNAPASIVPNGNDLAIDDISFRPCGPTNSASLDGMIQLDSSGVCVGKTLTAYGSLSTGYTAPDYLWQQSVDGGISWMDLPSSDKLQIDIPLLTKGDIKVRMLAAEGGNINTSTCRISSNLLILSGDPGPVIQLTPDTSVCPGIVKLLAQGASTYIWSPAQYLNDPNISNPVATLTEPVRFIVDAKDAQLCPSRDSFDVSIIQRPVFNAPPDTGFCMGAAIELKSNNLPTYIYAWSPPDGLDDPASPQPRATPAVSTIYSLHISEAVCGYDSGFQVKVDVHANPLVTAQRSNDIDCITGFSRLHASGALTYTWTPSTGLDDPASTDPLVNIDSTTIFLVEGIDKHGCYAYDTVTVKVTTTGKQLFTLPNAFTPNGDGHNDCFGIRLLGSVVILQFDVYNRWGERIFSTNNPSQCWDGSFKGRPQPVGTYTYIIRTKSVCGELIRKGTVVLIR